MGMGLSMAEQVKLYMKDIVTKPGGGFKYFHVELGVRYGFSCMGYVGVAIFPALNAPKPVTVPSGN